LIDSRSVFHGAHTARLPHLSVGPRAELPSVKSERPLESVDQMDELMDGASPTTEGAEEGEN